jgi:hypothetical protein
MAALNLVVYQGISSQGGSGTCYGHISMVCLLIFIRFSPTASAVTQYPKLPILRGPEKQIFLKDKGALRYVHILVMKGFAPYFGHLSPLFVVWYSIRLRM